MTFNGVIALIFSPNCITVLAKYVTLVSYNVRNILSPVQVFHFWPKLTTLQRGLSAIAELLVNKYVKT